MLHYVAQAMPLVGLVTAAAISNALRIIISVLTNYFLDGRLDDGRVLFPGIGLALCATVCSTAAQVSHRRTEAGKPHICHEDTEHVLLLTTELPACMMCAAAAWQRV